MKRLAAIISFVFIVLATGCAPSSEHPISSDLQAADTPACCSLPPAGYTDQLATDTVAYTGNIPVLCYHQVRDWAPKDSRSAKVYIVPVATFREEIKLLHENGYNAILPDQLLAHLQHEAPLPPKPVLLTFDDGDGSQISVALPELVKAGYKAAFFPMTVVLNRPGYFTADNVKALAAAGHVIGCHTWDHHMVTKYVDADWIKQVEKPRSELEKLTGQPIKYFAYPYGLWSPAAVTHLQQQGFTAAFMLAGKADHQSPLFTIHRQIVDGNWSPEQLLHYLEQHETSKRIAHR